MITERPYALEHVVRGSFLGCGVCFIANVCSCDSGGAAATGRSPSACCVFKRRMVASNIHPMNGAATPTKYMFMYKNLENCV